MDQQQRDASSEPAELGNPNATASSAASDANTNAAPGVPGEVAQGTPEAPSTELVAHASEESFPASDPPCWTLGRQCSPDQPKAAPEGPLERETRQRPAGGT